MIGYLCVRLLLLQMPKETHQKVLEEGGLLLGPQINAASEVGCLLQEGGLAAREHACIHDYLTPLCTHAAVTRSTSRTRSI